MAGNAAEWTYDRIGAQNIPTEIPQQNAPPISNPVYRVEGGRSGITRGGKVSDDDWDYTVYARSSLNRTNAASDAFGFRCVFSATTLNEMTRR